MGVYKYRGSPGGQKKGAAFKDRVISLNRLRRQFFTRFHRKPCIAGGYYQLDDGTGRVADRIEGAH
jgi:hypothetical protein